MSSEAVAEAPSARPLVVQPTFWIVWLLAALWLYAWGSLERRT